MNPLAAAQGNGGKGKRSRPLYLVPCILALLLSACGFHLRQPLTLPESMSRIQLQLAEGELAWEIRDLLAESGAQVVKAAENPAAVLVIGSERFEQSIAALDSHGRVTQYELRYTLAGSLSEPGGRVLVPEQRVVVRRLLDAATNILGTTTEEEQLRGDMRRDGARQLLRQVRTVLNHRPDNEDQAPPTDEAPGNDEAAR